MQKLSSSQEIVAIMPRPRMNICSYLHFLTAPQIILVLSKSDTFSLLGPFILGFLEYNLELLFIIQ